MTLWHRLGALPPWVALLATTLFAAALDAANAPPEGNSGLLAFVIFMLYLLARRRDAGDIAATVLAVLVPFALLSVVADWNDELIQALGALLAIAVVWYRYDAPLTVQAGLERRDHVDQ